MMIRLTKTATISKGGVPKSSKGRSRKRKADVAIPVQDADKDLVKKSKKKQWLSQYQASLCWNQSRPSRSSDQADTPFGISSIGSTRPSPLPDLWWGNKEDMWNNLVKKDQLFQRSAHLLERHPNLQPEMRSYLLDYLMRLCAACQLHRETFYLAQDYLDRFMATEENILPYELQLIGISSFFIAAKMEVIHYPTACQLAYITGGSCTAEKIIQMEAYILKKLDWKLNPVTPVFWLNLYMQMVHLEESSDLLKLLFPQETFIQIAELLDLCSLDVKSLKFSNSLLAAAALFHFTSRELAVKVSGLKWRDLKRCVKWMKPFFMETRDSQSSGLKSFSGIPAADWHTIQTHVPYMERLGRVHALKKVDEEYNQ